jgi:hypothetical protein
MMSCEFRHFAPRNARRGAVLVVGHKKSLLHSMRRATIARPVSLPNGRIPLRDPPCPRRQIGEGVSPPLDAHQVNSARDRYFWTRLIACSQDRLRRENSLQPPRRTSVQLDWDSGRRAWPPPRPSMASAIAAAVPAYDRRCTGDWAKDNDRRAAAQRTERQRMADYYARHTQQQEERENAEARERAAALKRKNTV